MKLSLLLSPIERPVDLQQRTAFFLRDLHARESMRLGCYRQMGTHEAAQDMLRERKARHEAFLRDLLRKRGISPFWYARFFYLIGHVFGLVAARLPQPWVRWFEHTLEFWILMRYQKYLKEMRFDAAIRSMIEAMQLQRMKHNEPAPDALRLLSEYVVEQELVVGLGSR